MTGNVDLDRLADYVGGALAGTPEEAAVARLVATNPLWTRAHAELATADAFVRADLAVLAAEPEPMPDAVMTRLADALGAEPPLTGSAPDESRPHLSVLPGSRATPTPSRARRHWRAVVGVAAASIVLGLGAVSLTQGLRSGGSVDSKTLGSNSAGQAVTSSSAGTASSYAAVDVRASGFDYDPGTLAALGGASIAARSDNSTKAEHRPDALGEPPQPAGHPTAVPDPLRRLTDPDARAACLKAVLARYGGTATMLDYARYQGSAALIVLLDGANGVTGRKWVVAVGPMCGTGGTIADQRYSGSAG
jgi:hypothetical protein